MRRFLKVIVLVLPFGANGCTGYFKYDQHGELIGAETYAADLSRCRTIALKAEAGESISWIPAVLGLAATGAANGAIIGATTGINAGEAAPIGAVAGAGLGLLIGAGKGLFDYNDAVDGCMRGKGYSSERVAQHPTNLSPLNSSDKVLDDDTELVAVSERSRDNFLLTAELRKEASTVAADIQPAPYMVASIDSPAPPTDETEHVGSEPDLRHSNMPQPERRSLIAQAGRVNSTDAQNLSGRYQVSIVGGGQCGALSVEDVDIAVAGSDLSGGNTTYRISGTVSREGEVTATALGRATVLLRGKLGGTLGSGTWDEPNSGCTGIWRIKRVADASVHPVPAVATPQPAHKNQPTKDIQAGKANTVLVPGVNSRSDPRDDIEEPLRLLKRLHELKLIDEEEYRTKRRQILDRM